MIKILAIFTCFNRRELTKRSIETLAHNQDVKFDFVIVDDNSTSSLSSTISIFPLFSVFSAI